MPTVAGNIPKIVYDLNYVPQIRHKYVDCHGRLMEPPARNSMWRFGYPNPVDYNDNELYCGGYSGLQPSSRIVICKLRAVAHL